VGHDGSVIIGGVITAAVGLLFFLAYYLVGPDLPVISALPPVVSGVIIPLVLLMAGGLLVLLGFLLRPSSRR
jgi:hypothetical protein